MLSHLTNSTKNRPEDSLSPHSESPTISSLVTVLDRQGLQIVPFCVPGLLKQPFPEGILLCKTVFNPLTFSDKDAGSCLARTVLLSLSWLWRNTLSTLQAFNISAALHCVPGLIVSLGDNSNNKMSPYPTYCQEKQNCEHEALGLGKPTITQATCHSLKEPLHMSPAPIMTPSASWALGYSSLQTHV